jgi:hypothetical protein
MTTAELKEGAQALGTFQVTDGKVMVSDPCYKRGTWCQGVLENVRNGQWNAVVNMKDEGQWGIRCENLIAYATPGLLKTEEGSWEKTDIDVGVDSGQAGIFSEAQYRDDQIAKEFEGDKPNFMSEERIADSDPGERWYGMCCSASITDNRGSAGIVPFGVVSSSGYGDGSYDCYIQKDDKGEIMGIKIDFMPEGEEEEDAD